MRNKNRIKSKKQQQGLALLATLMMVVIFTFIGMSIATKGKKNQEMTGANARNNMVFEASEMTLRNAIRFVRAIRNGEPKAGSNITDNTKGLVENFKIKKAIDNSLQFVTNPAYTFIWEANAIKNKVCTPATNCPDGLNFAKQIDDKNLWKYAIESTFTEADYGNNYLSHVKTYTFIELLRDVSANASTYERDGNFIGDAGRGYYYLITVKGSGFPPGADKDDILNARENVILQAVYAQKY